MKSCDVAVIGAGTAGLAARAAAAQAGADVVLIESGPGGTTCARVGCMPSKLVIAAAAAAHAARNTGLFGVSAGDVRIDGRAVMARVRAERDHFVESVLDEVTAIPASGRVQGRARFVGPRRLTVEGAGDVVAKAIVIATGARSSVPAELKAVADLVLTNESVFELSDLPESLAVVGAGPLGLELAQAFARLGVRVAVFDTSGRLAGISDPQVADCAYAILARELELHLETEISAERVPAGARLTWTGPAGTGTAIFARVLVAAGRPPDFKGLDLARSGLKLDEHGTPVFDRATMQCGASPVFIAGDADHDRPVLHEAANEGRIAGLNAARFPDVEPVERETALAITYTDPEIAKVGTGAPGPEARDEIATGAADLGQSGRARVMGRNAGSLRLYARRSDGLLVGAEMVGPEVEHLAHLVAWLVQLGLTADKALGLPFYHPTLEESIRTALREVCKETGSGGERAGSYLGLG